MSELRFEVTQFRSEQPTNPLRPVVCLARDRWDDFGHKTQFYATMYLAADAPRPLGDVKILKRGKLETAEVISLAFKKLGTSYVSLWQSPESYDRISSLAAYARPLLDALRDAATDPDREQLFHIDPGWQSLTRFPEALAALAHGRQLFGMPGPTGRVAFNYQLSSKAFGLEHDVDFEFDRDHPWGRMFVLAGANGTGKTGLLAHLAMSLSGILKAGEDPGVFEQEHPPLPVIAVSYSPFDRFDRPYRRSKGYRYCGLRDQSDEAGGHRIDVDRRLAEVGRMLRGLPDTRVKRIRSILTTLEILPRSKADAALDAGDFYAFADDMRHWSAGHQIVAIVVVHLVTWTARNSLVLFDEPELHLHPSLLSTLLRCIHELLVERDAFCVVATHSPIPVQEVPARFVRVLQRHDTKVTATIPPDETFGADLGRIVATVFRLGPEDQNYLTALLGQLESPRGADIVRAAFGDAPSLAVRVALNAHDKRSR
jgi:ABC-type cobalamin/Fe3+-siderophores transport system ATPase subunit